MKSFRETRIVACALALVGLAFGTGRAADAPRGAKPILLAHYLSWYEADPAASVWGWHWTMNHFDPNHVAGGRREIASLYYPLIGPYDSDDEDALECEAQLMKIAGFDGAVIDWMGSSHDVDYPVIARNAKHFRAVLRNAHLRFAVNYEEDVTLTRLTTDGTIAAQGVVPQVQGDMKWLADNWLSDPDYVEVRGEPLLLTFGGGFLKGDQWRQAMSAMSVKPALFSENYRRAGATGAFAWILPQGGTDGALAALDKFYTDASPWPAFVALAFPGFQDIYSQAGVGASYGTVDDQDGRTYEKTLTQALTSGAPVVQVATWNDWGEGTMIEPSVERGYRELETTQRLRKRYLDRKFPYGAADLRLPVRLYQLRKKHAADAAARAELDKASALIFAGQMARASALLDECDK